MQPTVNISAKVKKFVETMLVFRPKRFDDPAMFQLWLGQWERQLKQFEPWVLEAATEMVLADLPKENKFPDPGQVISACHEVKRRDKLTKPQMEVEQAPKMDRFAFAERLLDCGLGREAARDNPSWIVPLHDFIVENGRLPTGPEITRSKRIAHDGEQIEHAIALGQVRDMLPQMRQHRENLRNRRERFRQMLLGDEANNPAPSTFKPNPNYMDEERAKYRARMPENHRLASEWMDKICAEYGSFEQWHKVKRPPGSPFQNKRRGGAE